VLSPLRPTYRKLIAIFGRGSVLIAPPNGFHPARTDGPSLSSLRAQPGGSRSPSPFNHAAKRIFVNRPFFSSKHRPVIIKAQVELLIRELGTLAQMPAPLRRARSYLRFRSIPCLLDPDTQVSGLRKHIVLTPFIGPERPYSATSFPSSRVSDPSPQMGWDEVRARFLNIARGNAASFQTATGSGSEVVVCKGPVGGLLTRYESI